MRRANSKSRNGRCCVEPRAVRRPAGLVGALAGQLPRRLADHAAAHLGRQVARAVHELGEAVRLRRSPRRSPTTSASGCGSAPRSRAATPRPACAAGTGRSGCRSRATRRAGAGRARAPSGCEKLSTPIVLPSATHRKGESAAQPGALPGIAVAHARVARDVGATSTASPDCHTVPVRPSPGRNTKPRERSMKGAIAGSAIDHASWKRSRSPSTRK